VKKKNQHKAEAISPTKATSFSQPFVLTFLQAIGCWQDTWLVTMIESWDRYRDLK